MTLANGTSLYNHVTTSVGYASSSEPIVRFGLGKQATVRDVRTTWPGGQVQTIKDATADRIMEIRQERRN